MLLALVMVTAVLGSSRLRGAIALLFGLAIGIVGIDSLTGQPRATFGLPLLLDWHRHRGDRGGHLRRRGGAVGGRALRRRPAEIIPVAPG